MDHKATGIVDAAAHASRPASASHKSRSARGAFTLIELLVVVAIIALLIAILLPSLSGARDQAKAAVCAGRMREALRGTLMALLATGDDKVSTNFGWATTSLRNNHTETEVFTCPSDINPLPTPALFMRCYEPRRGTLEYRGETSGDGPYNHMGGPYQGNRYYVNMQDSVNGTYFGRDGGGGYYDKRGIFHGDIDVELFWRASEGDDSAYVITRRVESGWILRLYHYNGHLLGDARRRPRFTAPLIWGSYGLNVLAGLKNVKGNPVLIAEYSKWGIFPETLRSRYTSRPYLADNLKQKLRFRHGGLAGRADLRDPKDANYHARKRANVGFLDSHVERMGPEKLTDNEWLGWYGRRTSGDQTF
jgi:prepilin-type N-terminal cleavage/methylation domain-containing protein/prepilin-type processing-associated H-X9-DG protein